MLVARMVAVGCGFLATSIFVLLQDPRSLILAVVVFDSLVASPFVCVLHSNLFGTPM